MAKVKKTAKKTTKKVTAKVAKTPVKADCDHAWIRNADAVLPYICPKCGAQTA